ncbi:sensor histidine kinase [Paenibacillus silvisoli]|uniref:sensor histidine kinase n=1 Tax=Paenibacillus silvisoli TaxID=3110539 RepID=UPI0028049B6E|nr:histidine kinase [Paenibacillus silvisoli]
MKRMRSSPYDPIFIKIMLSFFVVVLPMFAIGLALNLKGAASVREEITTMLQTKVRYDMNTLEAELDRMIGLQYEMVVDNDLLYLSVADTVLSENERRTAILNLQRKLLMIRNSSNFIRSASAYIPLINRTIASDQLLDDLDRRTFDGLVTSDRRKRGEIVEWNDRLFIVKRQPDLSQGSDPIALLSLELSRTAIASELTRFSGNYDGGMVLLGNSLDWRIDQGAGEKLPAALEGAFEQLMKGSEGIATVEADGRRYIVAQQPSGRLDVTLLQFIPEAEVLGPLKQYRIWLWVLAALALVVILLYSYWMHRLIHKPFKNMIVAFRLLERGNLDLDIKHRSNDEFRFLYVQFNKMVRRLEASIQDGYVLKYRAQKAELKQLQSQINPHFLYNSFFTLGRMIKLQDYDNLMPFANHLGEYFRFITRDTKEEIPLEDEVSFSRSFAEIQNIRFHNRIQAEFGQLPEAAKGVTVPRLIIQPLIENAYKHGVEGRPGGGKVAIGFRLDREQVIVSVEDNGQGIDGDSIARLERALGDRSEGLESTGMINVHRRLQLKYGEDAGLRLSGGAGGGLRVELVIPYQRGRLDVQNHDCG